MAGYPKKHFESPNLKADLKVLKDWVDAGAHYIVTQTALRQPEVLRLEKSCREAGITVPIIPGLEAHHRGPRRSI